MFKMLYQRSFGPTQSLGLLPVSFAYKVVGRQEGTGYWSLIGHQVGLRTKANHFSSFVFYLEQSRRTFVVLGVLAATSTREPTTLAVIVVRAVSRQTFFVVITHLPANNIRETRG